VISRHSGCARFVGLSRRATKHVAWSAASHSNRLRNAQLTLPLHQQFSEDAASPPINHARYQRQPARQSTSTQCRSHIRHLHGYRSLALPGRDRNNFQVLQFGAESIRMTGRAQGDRKACSSARSRESAIRQGKIRLSPSLLLVRTNRSRQQAFLVNFDQCLEPRSLILTIDNALPGRHGKIPSGNPMSKATDEIPDETEREGRNQRQSPVGDGHHQRDRWPGHPQPSLSAQGQNEKLAGKVRRKVGQIEKVLEK
jgi:hypothetical protein